MPSACITFDRKDAVVVHGQAQFTVNPIAFGHRVIEAILESYEKMTGSLSPNHPLPFTFSWNNSNNSTETASDDR